MVDRFLLWLGAGLVTVGMSAGMLAGTGIAAADTGSGTDAGGTTSSQSTKPAEKKADSEEKPTADPSSTPADSSPVDSKPADDADKPKQDTPDSADPQPSPKPDADVTDKDDDVATDKDDDVATKDDDVATDPPSVATNGHKKTKVEPPSRLTKPVAATPEPDVDPAVDAKTSQDVTVEPEVTTVTEPAEELNPVTAGRSQARTQDAAVSAAVTFAAAPPSAAEITSTAAAPPFSGLLSAIGTIIFNLYGFATRLIGGPPILPPNSTVTVRSSTLRIDCADGYEVPADWYIPDTAEPPTRLIYLQHGFLAQGPWYSHTAAALAEQTNSIVVAPSITSNFLSCDACWLGAPPMQQAVANLFEDDNTALAESALAAGYSGPIPDRVVLVGHSLGGGLVAGTARYMVANETVDRLAGVVMLDGVGLDGSMAASLDKVPDGIPIYQLAAPKYFWNQFGVGTDALREARPNGFIGVTLVGGSHVDSMRGGNPLIQFFQQLVSGFSKPQNVAAAQILMVGWVNDMFACTQDPCTKTTASTSTPARSSLSTRLRARPRWLTFRIRSQSRFC